MMSSHRNYVTSCYLRLKRKEKKKEKEMAFSIELYLRYAMANVPSNRISTKKSDNTEF